MNEGETRAHSAQTARDRFLTALKAPGTGRVVLAWMLDAAALMILIALGWTLPAVLVFVGARLASRVPTMIGWGFMAALIAYIAVPALFVLFTSP
ncbi:MAG: hypothetical protein CMF75_06165 [Maricaulis sp.]|nr:hypothetical protein [Maricaulis sp.]